MFESVLFSAVDHHDGDCPRVSVGVRRTGETAVVSVADDGPGVPDAKKDGLFRAAESAVSAPGHGVGLVIARGLVDRYGGEIRVGDDEPTGAVFRSELPVASPGRDRTKRRFRRREDRRVTTARRRAGVRRAGDRRRRRRS